MSDVRRTQVGQDTHVEVELIDDQNNSEHMEFDNMHFQKSAAFST